MAIAYGIDKAREFGDRHEAAPRNPALEKEMDLSNNALGRLIAVSGTTAGRVDATRGRCRDWAASPGAGPLWIIRGGRELY